MLDHLEAPVWRNGSPEKTGVYYLIAIQYPNAVVYDILVWNQDRDGYYWALFTSKAAKVVGHIRLGDCLKYLTGYETPVENYSPIKEKLQWNFNEPSTKEVQLAVIPGSYDLIEWGDDGWSFKIEHCFGHIPLKTFIQAVEEKLPFNL